MATAGVMTENYRKQMSSVRVEKVVLIGAPNRWLGRKHVSVEQDSKEVEAELHVHSAGEPRGLW